MANETPEISGDSLKVEQLSNQIREGGSIPTSPLQFIVRQIPAHQTHEWLLNKHYAHRIPSISWAFGLYDPCELLQGVCTFGTPPSSPLREGICGFKHLDITLELNRLVVEDDLPANSTSFFVSKCLRLLPRPSIVISFADPSHGHLGIIYQACNFLYTGLSAKRTDWKVKGLEHLHGITIADMTRGQGNRAEAMRMKFGEDFYLEDRVRKHRYVYIIGDRKQRTDILKDLRYKAEPYPKGQTQRYDASYEPTRQGVLI